MLMGSLQTVVTQQQDRSRERYELLTRLAEVSKQIFPDIKVLIQEGNPSFHAQAYARDGQQIVTLYGGLAFHGRLQKDGLLFTILHEIGHHVAPGPRITCTSPLSCDCAADRWVIAEGRDLVASHGMRLDVQSALLQIELALTDLMPAYDLKTERLCFDWPRRKKALTSIQPAQVECELRKHHSLFAGGKNGSANSKSARPECQSKT